jgi:hypothetical protein
MLNLIAELKKHPNESGFFMLVEKARAFRAADFKQNACYIHRSLAKFADATLAINEYINEVQAKAQLLVAGKIHPRSQEDAKRRIMT